MIQTRYENIVFILWFILIIITITITITIYGNGYVNGEDDLISTTASTELMNICIASYNVLSSHLSDPDHYSTLNPMHLNPINRLPVVLKRITEEIENQNASIIIPQEVSHDWAGTFHKFFANHG